MGVMEARFGGFTDQLAAGEFRASLHPRDKAPNSARYNPFFPAAQCWADTRCRVKL